MFLGVFTCSNNKYYEDKVNLTDAYACEQFETTVLVVTHRIPTTFSLRYRHFIIENKGLYEVH